MLLGGVEDHESLGLRGDQEALVRAHHGWSNLAEGGEDSQMQRVERAEMVLENQVLAAQDMHAVQFDQPEFFYQVARQG